MAKNDAANWLANLISNPTLALLRHPDVLDRLRREPRLGIPLVEEVLRYDPPVQFRTRTTLADVEVAGVTIPRGATVVLLLASGSCDPALFPEADRSAAARPSPGSKRTSRWARSPAASPSPGESPTRRPTATTPPCAAPNTSSSDSTA